jgi:hypothetical protein
MARQPDALDEACLHRIALAALEEDGECNTAA